MNPFKDSPEIIVRERLDAFQIDSTALSLKEARTLLVDLTNKFIPENNPLLPEPICPWVGGPCPCHPSFQCAHSTCCAS